MSSKRLHKRRISLAIGAALLILAAAAFICRGWVRTTLLTAYVRTMYSHSVNQNFEGDFTDVTMQLQKLGLSFTKSPYDGCDYVEYEGLNATYSCSRGAGSKPLKLSEEYKTTWLRESPALEKYLLERGWHKTWNKRQPIDELLTRDDRDASVGVNYEKIHGKVACVLSIWYNGPQYEWQYQFNAAEACSRSIAFFGGY